MDNLTEKDNGDAHSHLQAHKNAVHCMKARS